MFSYIINFGFPLQASRDIRVDRKVAITITDLMQIWAASLSPDHDPPFANKADLYDTIDNTAVGDIPWESFTISYAGEMGEGEVAPWKLAMYDVWYRDPRAILKSQVANPDFANEMDVAPKVIRDDFKTLCQEIGQVVRRFTLLHCHSIPLYLQ
jgi:Plavaka transposase